MKVFFSFLLFFFSAFPLLEGMPPRMNHPQTRTSFPLEDLKHQLENHEVEMQMYEERLRTQETIVDSLREQFLDATLSQKEQFKGNTVAMEKKVLRVESDLAKSIEDLREMREHANQTSAVLTDYKKKIASLEGDLQQLQNDFEFLLKTLQVENQRTYTVQSGDMLEKIARKNGTTVTALKAANQLKNDKIFVGQKLKLP